MHASLTNLTFGAEFEVVLPRHHNRATAASAVAVATGLPVYSEFRSAIAGAWKVVSDGSISGNGIEFVSPILRGQDGLEQVRKITNALVTIGATVNQSCGFHVHVGARGETTEFFKALIKLYGKFETALDGVMPLSRRGDRNRYCASVIQFNTPAIDEANSIQQVIRAIPSRYYKLNLQAFAKHGTVEFRQHAGTVDADKAINWITVCLRLVLAAKQGKTGAGPRIASDFSRLDAKARAVAEAISRPEGATADEIRAAHGFKALSIKRQAQVAGLEVRVIKSRGKERFFLVAQTEAGRAVPATLDGLFEVIDATPEEVAFLRSRAARLAGAA